MTEQEKAERKAARKLKKWEVLGGQPKKIVARIDPIQWQRLADIRKKYGFKSHYEIMQYLIACFLRVADPDNDTSVEPVPEEIEMMFDSLADSEKHFEYVKPKRSINQASLNSSKNN